MSTSTWSGCGGNPLYPRWHWKAFREIARQKDVPINTLAAQIDAEVKPGNRIEGPAVIEEARTSIVLFEGQSATLDAYLNYVVEIAR